MKSLNTGLFGLTVQAVSIFNFAATPKWNMLRTEAITRIPSTTQFSEVLSTSQINFTSSSIKMGN